MSAKNPEERIAIVHGNKELILEFLEKFEMDRMHDGAPIKAVLVKGKIKKYPKNSIKIGIKND